MIALDKISDFNEVMQFYERMLNFTSKLREKIKIEELRKEAKEPTENELIAFYRAQISSETLRIIQIEEQFYNSGRMNYEFDNFFKDQSILKAFQVSEEQQHSENYKIRQVRNCLVHSMYNIGMSKNGEDVYLYLNNGKIKGAMRFDNFIEIANKYTSWYNEYMQYKNVGILTYDKNSVNTFDKKKATNKLVRSLKISGKSLSEKRMSQLKKWIDRIGIANFKLPNRGTPEEIEREDISIKTLLTDMINCTATPEDDLRVYEPVIPNYDTMVMAFVLGQLGLYFNEAELQEFVNDENIKTKQIDTFSKQASDMQNMIGKKESQETQEAFQKSHKQKKEYIANAGVDEYKNEIQKALSVIAVKRPFVYSDLMMSLSYYMFNYIREININNKIFDYINIDTSGFETLYQESGTEYTRTRNLREELEKVKSPTTKEKLEKNIKIYGEEVKDSSNFFRHIRDCIAHGWHKIDYSRYYNTRNLNEIMFEFPTYSPKDRELDFNVRISAKELLKVISQFKEKINEGINLSTEGKNVEREALRESLIHQRVGVSDIDIQKKERKSDKQKNIQSEIQTQPKTKEQQKIKPNNSLITSQDSDGRDD